MTLSSIACTDKEKVDPDNTVLIGLLLPFTGGDAALGAAYERAAIMARDTVNETGGIGGKPIVYITRDTHSDPKRAIDSLTEILTYPVVAILGPESSEIARNALPLSADHKTTLISPVISGAASIEIPENIAWYRLAPSSALLGRAFANYLIDNGVTSVAAVYANEDYHLDFAESFMARIAELGGTAAGSIVLPPEKSTYLEEISALKGFGTKNVLLSASTGDTARFVNDLIANDASGQYQWLLSPPLETSVLIQNTYKGAFNGALGIGIRVYDDSKEFIDMYKSRWNDHPIDGAFYYYDAVALLALSLETAVRDGNGKIDFETLQQTIRQTTKPSGIQVTWNQLAKGLSYIRDKETVNYLGLTGSVVFDNFGQQVIAPMKIWKISDDTFSNIDEL